MILRNSLRVSCLCKKHFTRTALENIAGQRKVLPPPTLENQYDLISETVSPLWRLDYPEQIVLKKNQSTKLVEFIKSQKLPKCKTVIHNVIPSPVIESYRNTDEFSIHTGVDGNEKTVGFFLGSPSEGKTICVPPIKLITLKEDHINLSQAFQELIRSSPLKACHILHDGGFWRNLIVRSNRKGDIMVIVICHPAGASKKDTEEAMALIKDYFLASHYNITSIYYQACSHARCNSGIAPFTLLHGDGYLYENINGITIRISPDSFSQINTEAVSLLYEAALRFINPDQRTTLLELICGTGIFSLIASTHVRGCIGMEYTYQSIQDALYNVKHNKISNCYFTAGNIEKKLCNILKDLSCSSNLVPIINPTATRFSKLVTKQLRNSQNIHRLIYLTCKLNSKGMLENIIDLCSTNFDSSQPFFLTDVQPVDMFPQTHMSEIILVFQR